jgi:hypothetical protein
MTAAEFAALREAGFGVDRGRIVDVPGKCPGFAAVPVFRGNGSVDRNATLSKVLWARDAEIARRPAKAERPAQTSTRCYPRAYRPKSACGARSPCGACRRREL